MDGKTNEPDPKAYKSDEEYFKTVEKNSHAGIQNAFTGVYFLGVFFMILTSLAQNNKSSLNYDLLTLYIILGVFILSFALYLMFVRKEFYFLNSLYGPVYVAKGKRAIIVGLLYISVLIGFFIYFFPR